MLSSLRRWADFGERHLATSFVELDLQHPVHPVASFRGYEARGVCVLKSASGAHVLDAEGCELSDDFTGL